MIKVVRKGPFYWIRLYAIWGDANTTRPADAAVPGGESDTYKQLRLWAMRLTNDDSCYRFELGCRLVSLWSSRRADDKGTWEQRL